MLCPAVAAAVVQGKEGGKGPRSHKSASLTARHLNINKRQREMKNPEVKREGKTITSIRKNACQSALKAPRLRLLLSDH